MKKVLITGITGQVGRYLVELLLQKNCEVFGMVRRTSSHNLSRLTPFLKDITLLNGDMTDEGSIVRVIKECKPDHVYNLAGQSLVPLSFDQPVLTAEVTALGVTKILSAIRIVDPSIKFLTCSSSEMYGTSPPPQSETTNFHPRSPYAISKVYGFWATVNARESYNMFASNAILFNNESFFRGEDFVTRKITLGIKKILNKETNELRLGNISAKRDWGFTGDTVKAMYLILNHTEPDDFVVSTGETHSVEEFLEIAFSYVGLNWRDYVIIDTKFMRPAEVPVLLGDSTKIKNILGWAPEYNFYKLVHEMVSSELKK